MQNYDLMFSNLIRKEFKESISWSEECEKRFKESFIVKNYKDKGKGKDGDVNIEVSLIDILEVKKEQLERLEIKLPAEEQSIIDNYYKKLEEYKKDIYFQLGEILSTPGKYDLILQWLDFSTTDKKEENYIKSRIERIEKYLKTPINDLMDIMEKNDVLEDKINLISEDTKRLRKENDELKEELNQKSNDGNVERKTLKDIEEYVQKARDGKENKQQSSNIKEKVNIER